MTQRQYPTYNSEDVKCWLAKVFGKGIFFESQQSREAEQYERESGDGGDTDFIRIGGALDCNSYTNELGLSIDLPPFETPYFAKKLRAAVALAIAETLRAEVKTAEITGTKVELSAWPSPYQVIRDDLTIDLNNLQILAERIRQPAGYTESIVNEMLAHEAAWIERKKSLARFANEIFLGIKPDNNIAKTRFSYAEVTFPSEGCELRVIISHGIVPYWPGHHEFERARQKRNHDLGLNGMLAYVSFNRPWDKSSEYKLALCGVSDMAISNQLDVLCRPDTLLIARQYIHEVIAATDTGNWFRDTNTHPDYYEDLESRCADLDEIYTGVVGQERNRRRRQMEQTKKYKEWAAIFPQLMKDYPVFGDFVRAVHGAAPEGHEAVYARLRQWTADHFPLLMQHLSMAAIPAPPRPTALPPAQQAAGTQPA